ncbi:MAG: hypothetical protein ACO3XJ_03695 [Candidatus Nanopelagicales bacterium]
MSLEISPRILKNEELFEVMIELHHDFQYTLIVLEETLYVQE